MSGDVIPFVPRADRRRDRNGIACSVLHWPKPDDLVMHHADTAPCEYAAPDEDRDRDGRLA
jgi:hypothetical protein